MIPENVEEDLLAERDVASVCAASKDTEVGSTPAVRGSLVAFKFGGSSLLGAERMRHAAGLVRPAAQLMEVVVVVSAMKGVTDRLLGIAQTLGERNTPSAAICSTKCQHAGMACRRQPPRSSVTGWHLSVSALVRACLLPRSNTPACPLFLSHHPNLC